MTTPLKRPQSHGRVWSAWREHWPEYLIESWGLGTFMISACVFATLLENPDFPFRDAIPSAGLRRALMGLAMGLTAVGIIYSPWGHRSGARREGQRHPPGIFFAYSVKWMSFVHPS